MNEVGLFNCDKTVTNKDLVISFLPSENVKAYAYQIYRDDKPFGNLVSNVTGKSDIKVSEQGSYFIHVKAILNDEKVMDLYSEKYIVDLEKPVIEVNSDSLVIKENIQQSIMDNVTFSDNDKVTLKTSLDSISLKKDGYQTLTYTAIDRAGNETIKDIKIKINHENTYMFGILSIILMLLIILSVILFKVEKALKLEKRLENFTVKSFKEKKSLSENFLQSYKIVVKKISKILEKSVFLQKYYRKLEKYLPVTDIYENGCEIFSGKILIGILFTLSVFIIKMFKFELLDYYSMVVVFTFSFFTLDVLYFAKYRIYRIILENEFISAITIMNNAFKSGRSITQAIDTVSTQLTGPIGREFERMSVELLYGLGIDVVFKRFSKRIDLEEANYLTASLTILNKTGGDIIKVFDSIERSMFDRKKLRLELKSLTSGSKIVVGVLLLMPFFFVIVIGIINPEYFIPFLTTPIGIILLIFMIIYYIIFLVVVRKVMKVVV